MAEYINRNLIEWYGCNFENADCENRECSGCSHAECSHSQVMQIPTADVIERSRYEQLDKEANALSKAYQEEHEKYKQLRLNVAKAIKEMENIELVMFCDEMRDYCVEILQRNIGE